VRGTATTPPDVVAFDLPAAGKEPAKPVRPKAMRQLSDLMGEAWADIELVAPQEVWTKVDGRRIQGWFYEAAGKRGKPAPTVVEIHGGPATLYGHSLLWEWQVMVGRGLSVFACNPRGSTGYGQAYAVANFRDWGPGPQADIEAGLAKLAKAGKVDLERVGVTGGSYGGYLTAWMIGHSDRYRAAAACRGVYDLSVEMTSGDLGGPLFGHYELDAQPWTHPELYREMSPLTYADAIETPLLIQHAEQDLRCPITQAEQLFSILRSLKRPVRLMRVPGESHELTRSGTPFRRIENIERIGDWFVHFLVDGARTLPRT
jgi:dipeptidyl aminopeptidase/acylaminoacyl peptidase